MRSAVLRVFGLAMAIALGAGTLAFPGAGAQVPVQPCTSAGPARFFWHYNCIEEEFARLQTTYPEIATYYDIGNSVNGNPIYVLEVANFSRQAAEPHRPGFYLDATHHGNEIQGTEGAMRLAQKVTAEYGTNETVTRWVDEFNIYINPVVNPDGNIANQRQNANGVDLNRNYPFDWGLRAGAYGPGPGSEPEVQANMAFMRNHSIDAYASLHTGTWDYVAPRCSTENTERAPTDDEDLHEFVFAEVVEASGMDGIRGASGTGESICWAYDVIEVFSILPEVTTEQSLPFTAQETTELNGAMLGLYWLLNQTGRYGATLEARLVADLQNESAVAIELRNVGMAAATEWTLEINRAGDTAVPYATGNQRIDPGAVRTVAVPSQYLAAGAVYTRLSYNHLLVDPLVSDPQNGTPRDPMVRWLNFTQEEAEQVVIDAGGTPSPTPSGVPGLGPMIFVFTLLVAALFFRRRGPGKA